MTKKLNYIDLFAGCGGLSDGFEQSSRFNLLAAVEWESAPCKTFANRLEKKWKFKDANKRVLRFDIQRTGELLDGWGNDPVFGSGIGLRKLVGSESVDVIIGGPPCQAYSLAGRIRDKHGMHKDYRNFLFESYLKVVGFFQPKAIIFENVEGILSAKPGGVSIIERIRKGFESYGYELIEDLRGFALLDLSEFGVPQTRKRVILLAVRKKDFPRSIQPLLAYFYSNLLTSFKVNKKKTVAEAIGDLPPFKVCENEIKEGGRRFSHYPFKTGISNHNPRFHNERDVAIFKELAHDIQRELGRYKTIESLKALYRKHTGKNSNIHKYYVLRWEKPSNTIVAHLHKDGLRHIHPDFKQARSITVREAARLQTFDDCFEFLGSVGDQYKMIGNAVPPLFAHKLALALEFFFRRKKDPQKSFENTLKG